MNAIYTTSFRSVARRVISASSRAAGISPSIWSDSFTFDRVQLQKQDQQRRGLATPKKKKGKGKRAIIGGHGSRGRGWFIKYREGRGGRHLQGEYWDRNQHHWDMPQWNDAVLSLGSKYIYLDVAIESPSAEKYEMKGRDQEAIDISVAIPEPDEDDDSLGAANPGNAAEDTSDDSADKEHKRSVVTTDGLAPVASDEPINKTERLIIQVASTVMPETCNNFIGLIQDAAYNGSILYRIEKEVGICGGDILTNTGKTGQCWQHWPKDPNAVNTRIRPSPLRRDLPSHTEEPLAMWHTAGTVAMLCAKVNEIDSRFILCGKDSPHLDGIHRAFGKLKPESLAVVQEWQANILTSYGKPKSATLRIVDCGVLDDYN